MKTGRIIWLALTVLLSVSLTVASGIAFLRIVVATSPLYEEMRYQLITDAKSAATLSQVFKLEKLCSAEYNDTNSILTAKFLDSQQGKINVSVQVIAKYQIKGDNVTLLEYTSNDHIRFIGILLFIVCILSFLSTTYFCYRISCYSPRKRWEQI